MNLPIYNGVTMPLTAIQQFPAAMPATVTRHRSLVARATLCCPSRSSKYSKAGARWGSGDIQHQVKRSKTISRYAATASATTAHTAFGLQSAKTSPDGP